MPLGWRIAATGVVKDYLLTPVERLAMLAKELPRGSRMDLRYEACCFTDPLFFAFTPPGVPFALDGHGTARSSIPGAVPHCRGPLFPPVNHDRCGM